MPHGAEDAQGRQGRRGRARARAARDGVVGQLRRDATTLETGTCCGVQWSTDGDAPKGVQGIVSGLHEESDRDQRALLRK